MGIFSQANKEEDKKLPFGKRRGKGAFGKKANRLKPRSKKMQIEKLHSNPYNSYLHNSGQACIVCGNPNIEIHHITDIKRIKGKRRCWKRAVTLCDEHHNRFNSKVSIHALSDRFYVEIMSFKKLMWHSDRLWNEYQDYLRSKI